MSDVDYAGPVANDPASRSPPTKPSSPSTLDKPVETEEPPRDKDTIRPYVTVKGELARLHLVSQPGGLTFHRVASIATAGSFSAIAYDRLCTAPCVVELPSGAEKLSLSKSEGNPIKPQQVNLPAGDSQLVGTYHSRSGLRIAGVLAMLAGVGGAVGLMYAALSPDRPNMGFLAAGLGVGLGGTVAGSVLVLQRDYSTFELKSKQSGGIRWPQEHLISFRGTL
jgi:hypothetical protein